jgi:uncharacterized protein
MICYLDSSALVKLFLDEPGAAEVSRALDEAYLTGTVSISRAEVIAALSKAVRRGALSLEDATSARHRFRIEWPDYFQLQVSDLLIDRACDLAWTHGLRGYDSVQLAAALIWQAAIDEPVVMATFDIRLWETAGHLGLEPYPRDLPKLRDIWKR